MEVQADETAKKLTSAATVIAASCSLLNLRARYVGGTGEHFSVQEYEGIQVVDSLDERPSILAGHHHRAPNMAGFDLCRRDGQ